MRETNWKRLAILLGVVAVVATMAAGYWFNVAASSRVDFLYIH